MTRLRHKHQRQSIEKTKKKENISLSLSLFLRKRECCKDVVTQSPTARVKQKSELLRVFLFARASIRRVLRKLARNAMPLFEKNKNQRKIV